MRPIDADALAREIEKIKWNLQMLDDTQSTDKVWNGVRMAEKKVEHAPTIDAVPQWIPCEERLPNEEGEYLVSMTWVTMPEFKEVMVLDYRPNAGFETINAYRADAWMPLPKPYEGEKKDNG